MIALEVLGAAAGFTLLLLFIALFGFGYSLGLQQKKPFEVEMEARPPRPEVQPLEPVTITTNEVVAVDQAIALANEVLPELERQTRLTKRYRREKNNAERKLRSTE